LGSTYDETRVAKLLARIGETPEGETVVANVLRSLEGEVVSKDFAKVALMGWCDIVHDNDTASLAGSLDPQAVLNVTQSFAFRPTYKGYVDDLLSCPGSPVCSFAGPEAVHVKSLQDVTKYIFGVPYLEDEHTGVPLPAIEYPPGKFRENYIDDAERAIKQRQSKVGVSPNASIAGRPWFWVARKEEVERKTGHLSADDKACAVVDFLGLVHLSHPASWQQPETRYVVVLELDQALTTPAAKPSFVFSDHNPRFVAWTALAVRSDVHWGRAADLERFEEDATLTPGGHEMVVVTPPSLSNKDVVQYSIVGYLEKNRWGRDHVARGTAVFADRLRSGSPQGATIATIVSLLR
jgi:hypothetical protein